MDIRDIIGKRPLIFDGAMGTYIQILGPNPKDYDGHEGLGDILNLTRPDLICRVHEDYLKAGADIIETNTFNSNPITLAEYNLTDKMYELNLAGAQIARKIADKHSTKEKPRFVYGDFGSTSKLPSLNQISFDDMSNAYREQALALIEGGVDILGASTCQDLLQCKAFIIGAKKALKESNKDLPMSVSLTFEKNGNMLLGSDVATALTSLEAMDIDIIGVNCATGPREMEEIVRYLSKNSPIPIAILPNAGMPENVDGKAVYNLPPEEFVKWQRSFVENFNIDFVGGCCGTTPKYIELLSSELKDHKLKKRKFSFAPSVASLYQSLNLAQEPRPFIIGERTNASGSKVFKEFLEKDDFEGMINVAQEQQRSGAHALDISVAQPGRDEPQDMESFLKLLVTRTQLPIMIDSTDPKTIERALKLIGGKAIVNSINLEDGGEKLNQVLALVKNFGASVVALTIDKEGMAITSKRKLEIADEIYKIATEKFKIKPHDILFDLLTFSLGSGDPQFIDSAKQTVDAIKRLRKRYPRCFTSLGVSNVSYGLKPRLRRVLNSVFLHEAIEAGLDCAIINAKKITPLHKISKEEVSLAKDVIYNKKSDALTNYICYFDATTNSQLSTLNSQQSNLSIEEKLRASIIDGTKENLDELLDRARDKYSPLEIINKLLLDGMKEVGELFGAGKTQLPFVLQSAEVMKCAVDILKPHMKHVDSSNKGSIVLATVRGDIHDIGKNLVDIILSNNGYKVYNLGVKQPIEAVIEAVGKYHPDLVGLSGLLVKSTQIMLEDLGNLAKRGFSLPIICGGAALNEKFVKKNLSEAYGREVFYGKDAFSALKVLEKLI